MTSKLAYFFSSFLSHAPLSSHLLTPPSPLQLPGSDSPSPPPGFTKPSLVVPLSVAGITARSPFEGAAAESQSLFSDNSNFRHPNPMPSSLGGFHSSPQNNSDWPTAPEPHSLFTSGGVPTSLLELSCEGLLRACLTWKGGENVEVVR